LIVGGVGVVGLAVGSIFGVLAFSKESQARQSCPDTDCATREGVDLHDQARTEAAVSTIGFAGGAVLVAAGLVLVLTSPSTRAPASSQLRLRLQPGGLRLASFF
jgi:hypothetical protein